MSFGRVIFVFLYTLACASCTTGTNTNPIDAVLEDAVESGRIPGVIAIAARSDGTVYRRAVGMRNLASKSDMTIDTIVQIASMTKAVTSVAVLQLEEQGKIELDHPVGMYLPRFAGTQILEGFDTERNPILRSPENPVTIRQLLSHTSGYSYEFLNADIKQYLELNLVESIFNAGGDFIDAPLVFEPGTNWEYGISFAILGVLVETISGQRLDEYFTENIFKPLEMKDTHYILPDEKLHRLATIYFRSKNGEMTALPYSKPSDEFFDGGGGLYSTADDYIRFLRALLNNGELDGQRILDAETIDRMAQNQIGDLEAAGSIVSLMPEFSKEFDYIPNSEDKFGLGFLINTEPVPGGRSAGSLAWAGFFNTHFWVDRERDACGVLMTQILPFYDADVMHLMGQFETAVYSSLVVTEN